MNPTWPTSWLSENHRFNLNPCFNRRQASAFFLLFFSVGVARDEALTTMGKTPKSKMKGMHIYLHLHGYPQKDSLLARLRQEQVVSLPAHDSCLALPALSRRSCVRPMPGPLACLAALGSLPALC
jgi:hypothetical protein